MPSCFSISIFAPTTASSTADGFFLLLSRPSQRAVCAAAPWFYRATHGCALRSANPGKFPASFPLLHRCAAHPATAVLSKTSHADCCTTLTNRPLRPREGRFVRVVQQLACEVFERTAVASGNDLVQGSLPIGLCGLVSTITGLSDPSS